MIKIILLFLFTTLLFPQIRVSFEIDGRFQNEITDPGILVSYDYIPWQQKNVSAGIGAEIMSKHNGLNSSPEGMAFNSLYFIVNYAIEETWNAYSKVGVSFAYDDENFFTDTQGLAFGFGIDKNFDDKYHIQAGYHLASIGPYNFSSFILSSKSSSLSLLLSGKILL